MLTDLGRRPSRYSRSILVSTIRSHAPDSIMRFNSSALTSLNSAVPRLQETARSAVAPQRRATPHNTRNLCPASAPLSHGEPISIRAFFPGDSVVWSMPREYIRMKLPPPGGSLGREPGPAGVSPVDD